MSAPCIDPAQHSVSITAKETHAWKLQTWHSRPSLWRARCVEAAHLKDKAVTGRVEEICIPASSIRPGHCETERVCADADIVHGLSAGERVPCTQATLSPPLAGLVTPPHPQPTPNRLAPPGPWRKPAGGPGWQAVMSAQAPAPCLSNCVISPRVKDYMWRPARFLTEAKSMCSQKRAAFWKAKACKQRSCKGAPSDMFPVLNSERGTSHRPAAPSFTRRMLHETCSTESSSGVTSLPSSGCVPRCSVRLPVCRSPGQQATPCLQTAQRSWGSWRDQSTDTQPRAPVVESVPLALST